MINNEEIKKLRKIQPLLKVYTNQIKGIFSLSASFDKKSKKIKYPSSSKLSPTYFENTFKIQIDINKDGYPIKTFNTDDKISKWKNNIPLKYWHVNRDNSLCLGVDKDIKKHFEELPYSEFINYLLTCYFYYMSYFNNNHTEPWIAYRHDQFSWLDDLELSIRHLSSIETMVARSLLQNINGLMKIQNKDNCPFCNMSMTDKINTKKSHKCKEHKTRIKNHNFLLSNKNKTDFKKLYHTFMSVA